MKLLCEKQGQSTVELVLLIMIIAVVLGTVTYSLFEGIAGKLVEYNDAL